MPDTYNYQGWIHSDSFIKRSIAIFLYSTFGSFLIYFLVFGTIAIIGLLGLTFWGILMGTEMGISAFLNWLSTSSRHFISYTGVR